MYQTHEKKKMAIVYNGFISQKWMIEKAKKLILDQSKIDMLEHFVHLSYKF